MPDLDRQTVLTMDDRALAHLCRCDCFRASGPGGQHRNTTDSAVRLTLPGREISAACTDHRSQHRNRAEALRRLRVEIALQWREDAVAGYAWPGRIGRRDQRYLPLVAQLLDQIVAADARLAEAARRAGISTGRLVRILAADHRLWTWISRARERRGLGKLKRP